jgi:cholesterol oxidase
LRRVNGQLGRYFSGNGDFLSFIVGADQPVDPNSGPVITQGTDCNLFENYDSSRAFILQDAGYPHFAAWLAEGAKPGFLRLNSLRRFIRHFIGRLGGSSAGSIAYALEDLLSGDISYNTCVLLCMGIDSSNGIMKLNRDGWLDLEWPQRQSHSLYNAILEEGKNF